MAAPILVTGGTGTLGRHVVPLLLEAGCDVRVLSRGRREPVPATGSVVADLSTGEAVAAAVAGVEVVVHCAGSAKGDGDKARHLVRAASAAGVRHVINISVVGADRVPVVSAVDRAMFGYFASKLDAERVIAESGVPWTTLRATQFHDLTLTTVRGMARMPVIPAPRGFRFQPVETAEVAGRLVELALGSPAGLVPDLAGPVAYEMADLLRSYLHATGKRRVIVPAALPGGAARAVRAGANLALDRAVGSRRWEEFLAAAVREPAAKAVRR